LISPFDQIFERGKDTLNSFFQNSIRRGEEKIKWKTNGNPVNEAIQCDQD